MNKSLVIRNWDRAYSQGKYYQEVAIPFVDDIKNALTANKLTHETGFYPGCGNGRNLIPLIEAGLKIEANDISPEAIRQLQSKVPHVRATVGDFMETNPEQPYGYILSLQLFQHTDQAGIIKLFQKTYDLLRPAGIFALRVNSIHTQIEQQHTVTDHSQTGGFTIQYHSGHKEGQYIHFYSAEEIHSLTGEHFETILPLREEFIPRNDGTYWAQWETILRKKH